MILEIILPQLLTGARVYGENMVRDSEVCNAVHHQRSRLDCRVPDAPLRPDARDPVHPLDLQRIDIRLVDLFELAVTAAGVISVVRWPDIGRLIEQLEGLGVETLSLYKERHAVAAIDRSSFKCEQVGGEIVNVGIRVLGQQSSMTCHLVLI